MVIFLYNLSGYIFVLIQYDYLTDTFFALDPNNNVIKGCGVVHIYWKFCPVCQELTHVMLNKLMPCPLLVSSQSDYLIQGFDRNSHI